MDYASHAELPLAHHFTMLVYPFRHALEGKGRSARLRALEQRWHPWWRRLDTEALKTTLDDTYFFLPYIRELLFPETALLPEGDAAQQLPAAARLARSSAAALASRVPPDAVLRLTYDPQQLERLRHPRLELAKHGFAAEFTVCWVDAILFPQGLGLLLLKVQLQEQRLTVRHLNDFLYYARLLHPPRVDWELASWRLPDLNGAPAPAGRDVVDFFLQGLTPDSAAELQPFEAWVTGLGNVARYTSSRLGQVYGEIFRLYTYACLANPPLPNRENVERAAPSPSRHGPPGTSLFASPVQRVLYELATCHDTSDPTYLPHASYLGALLDRHLIAFWDNWQGMALQDHVVFLGLQDTRFTREVLAHNVESDYFHLYLFTLYQKLWLSITFGELIRRRTKLSQNLRAARHLWDAFILFENHYWFAEVTRKPQGTELYRCFQRGLEVLPLYKEMSAEVQKLQAYYEGKVERRIGTLLNFLTFVGLPASLLVELFSNALIRQASWAEFGVVAATVYLVLGILGLIWRALNRG